MARYGAFGYWDDISTHITVAHRFYNPPFQYLVWAQTIKDWCHTHLTSPPVVFRMKHDDDGETIGFEIDMSRTQAMIFKLKWS